MAYRCSDVLIGLRKVNANVGGFRRITSHGFRRLNVCASDRLEVVRAEGEDA